MPGPRPLIAGENCKNGHVLDEGNTMYRKGGKLSCKTCQRMANRRQRGMPDGDGAYRFSPEMDAERCRKGHLRTPENRYVEPSSGRLRCRACFRDHNLRKHYGIGLTEYEELLSQQEGRCAICRAEFATTKETHVDHDHATGVVRGLLCDGCNVGIGHFKEDPASLLAAVQYLKKGL